jgi:predicted signal transduction protein with EAL and GGDEF domain
LTQLPNRRLLMDRLGAVILAQPRNPKCGALLFIDVDNFKDLNDTMGHPTGDQLLVQIAARLAAYTGAQDTLARLGGDEFVVLLQGLSEDEVQAQSQARTAMAADLNQSLIDGDFLLYYQPQIDAAGQQTGVEALVRWQHPQRGLVSPAEFIPTAEGSGLIVPLGRWILQEACRQLAAWAAVPATAGWTVAVNISARQFRQADFVPQVTMALRDAGADPLRLKLELTESLLVDQLRIDQSFVRDLLTDPQDASIVRAIVMVGTSLELQVIAEGVETADQRDALLALGCQHFQGYFFGRPVPA